MLIKLFNLLQTGVHIEPVQHVNAIDTMLDFPVSRLCLFSNSCLLKITPGMQPFGGCFIFNYFYRNNFFE